jgi:hypothetical protein
MKLPGRNVILSIFFMSVCVSSYAQAKQDYEYASASAGPLINHITNSSADIKAISDNKGELKVLSDLENSFNKKPSRKLLLSFLQKLNSTSNSADQQTGSKLYSRFAGYFARLKLYPLVMKCYFKTSSPDDDVYRKGYFIRQNSANRDSAVNVTDSLDAAGLLAINSRDSLLLKTDSGLYNHNGRDVKSIPIRNAEITNPFDDGKRAVKYALLVHIQQPRSGKRKIFAGLNIVGHTFITLIKYNRDSTYVARTFGFYPKKDHILSATPIFPSSTPLFKNDEQHDWDEVVGKFISAKKFQRILQLVKEYESRRYDLNTNNCTDFGLNAADIGGIKISGTFGKWPFGRGNNPASAGMSLLEGKVTNTDPENPGGLFIYDDLVREK